MLKRITLVLMLVGTSALESAAQAQPAATVPDAATIADVNSAFDAGWLTSEQLVQMFLARIKEFDRQGPSVRALIVVSRALRR